MQLPGAATLAQIDQDLDGREALIREIVYDTLAEWPDPPVDDHVVATYFVVAKSMRPEQVGVEIAYHMTSGVRRPPLGTLLAECSGKVIDAIAFDPARRIGMVRVAFPLKMLLDQDGGLYSTDILHIVAGAGVFELTEHADIKLVQVSMSDESLRRFPGPAHGPEGVRGITGFSADEIAFGTILKPCTGMTPEEEAGIVAEAAANPMFLFVKEDENFMPGVPFAPLASRLKASLEAVRRTTSERGGKGLIYAPHITAPPYRILDHAKCAIDAGANGIMFSEYYTGGAVRAVREMTRAMPNPPAIYGHNGGITTRVRHIYREVLDMFARLDGVDFRQTAPVAIGPSLLRPAGREWRECERVLCQPLAGHRPVMIARAGGLDQGNIIGNLLDVSSRGGPAGYLFLAGSAINGIRNDRGDYDPLLGAEAMREALDVYRQGVFAEYSPNHVIELKAHAGAHGLRALSAALSQRYRDHQGLDR